MTKFRKGDVVKCVDVGYNKEYMTLGKMYVISNVDTHTPGWIFYEFLGDGGVKGAATEEKFELVHRDESAIIRSERSDTMKVTYTETVKREIEVPGHYGYDESLKGQMVDILLGGSHIRDDIYGEDKPVVLNAIALLEGAYEKVERILTIVRDHPEALK